MRNKRLITLIFSGLLLMLAGVFPVSPASARTEHDEQLWANFTVIGNVNKFAYFVEAQPRIGNGISRTQQLLLRPAVGYRLTDTVTAYVGYAHVFLPIENGRDRNEERIFGQLNWALPKVAGGSGLLRTRIERRTLSHGEDTGWRLRQLVRYVHPLGNPKHARPLIQIEGFVALNKTDWGARDGFDQLRTLVGFEVPLFGRSTMDVGYQNQTINDPGGRIRMNHTAAFTFWIRP
ncbi:DUF2490 domain-containing protein [Sphingomonas sp. AP4-R1]|nr:DUF2490 domain-containing protein [Sphingomonas sp. AP4-R1]